MYYLTEVSRGTVAVEGGRRSRNSQLAHRVWGVSNSQMVAPGGEFFQDHQ